MTYKQDCTDKGDYLLCVTEGVATDIEELVAWTDSVLGLAKEAGLTKILCDNRMFFLKMTPSDVAAFTDRIPVADAVSAGLRMACVPSPCNPDLSRITETFLVKSSASYKVFHSKGAAREWLLKD